MEYKLLDWIDPDKIKWIWLSRNPAAIHLLEQQPRKINWYNLSRNPAAINLLEQNPNKINWGWLSENPAAIHLLEQHPEKIDWHLLSHNPSIFELDFQKMKHKQCAAFKEELMQRAFHPSRIANLINEYEIDVDMLDDCL